MSRLSFHDVHKSFRAVKALRGVGFSVEAGEAHAIVGENGAGKSTLLHILSEFKAGKPPASPIVDSGVDVVTAANVDEYVAAWKKVEAGQ